VEIISVSLEDIVRRHPDDDEEISSVTALGSVFSFSRQSQTHAVVDSSRHVDLQGRFLLDPPLPTTGLARVAIDATYAGTRGAGLGHRQKAPTEHDLAVAATGAARLRGRTGFGPTTLAGIAFCEPWHPNRSFNSRGGFLERDAQGVLQIVTSSTPLPATPLPSAENVSKTEEITQNIGEITKGTGVEAREGLALDPLMAEAIESSALLRIGQNGVRLRGFLESLLSLGISRVPVRMVLYREAPIGHFDLINRGVASDTEDVVVITWIFGAHCPSVSFPLPVFLDRHP